MAAIFEAPATHEAVHEAAQEWEWEHHEGAHQPESHEWEAGMESHGVGGQPRMGITLRRMGKPRMGKSRVGRQPRVGGQPRMGDRPRGPGMGRPTKPKSGKPGLRLRNGRALKTEGSHEWEGGLESQESHEWEGSHEWESPSGEWESHEWESHEWEASPEWEADPFIGKAFKAIGRGIGKLAKRLAPFAVRALGGMIPGVGAIAGPVLGQIAQPGDSRGRDGRERSRDRGIRRQPRRGRGRQLRSRTRSRARRAARRRGGRSHE